MTKRSVDEKLNRVAGRASGASEYAPHDESAEPLTRLFACVRGAVALASVACAKKSGMSYGGDIQS